MNQGNVLKRWSARWSAAESGLVGIVVLRTLPKSMSLASYKSCKIASENSSLFLTIKSHAPSINCVHYGAFTLPRTPEISPDPDDFLFGLFFGAKMESWDSKSSLP